MSVKGYKIIPGNWVSRDMEYSCPGEFKVEGKLRICGNGIHFSREFIDCFKYYDLTPESHMVEVEALGEVLDNKAGSQSCTDHIKIIRELSRQEIYDIGNTGLNNEGVGNTGDGNKGNFNSGTNNVGHNNVGSGNVGDGNTGSYNFGDYNNGTMNEGDCNNGTGNFGVDNFGIYNTGNRNCGKYNVGEYNDGWFNCTDNAFGMFNTAPAKPYMFNKQVDEITMEQLRRDPVIDIINTAPPLVSLVKKDKLTDEQKKQFPYWETIGAALVYCKKRGELMQKWYDEMPAHWKALIKSLPNFDAKIFKECTGIDVNKK